MRAFANLLRRLGADERGVTATIVALCVTFLVGMTAMGIDFGYLYNARQTLQAATDAAALAGAQDINQGTGGTAITMARTYSAEAGKKNAGRGVATMATGYPQLRCLTSIQISCSGPDNANAIVVTQKQQVPTFFAKIFGYDSWNLEVTSTAAAKGGSQAPLDVMIVLDTTASMNTLDPSCSLLKATRLDCALHGVRTLLASMPPCSPTLANCGTVTGGHVSNPIVEVGLMTFPGLKDADQVKYEYDCSGTNPAIAKYSATPVYEIVPLSSNYRTSASAGLDTSTIIVKAARGGEKTCAQGISAVGGVGTFFADVLDQAQSALKTRGRADAQKVIIVLSDGDAGASSGNMPSAKAKEQCKQAVDAAARATAAGTWVYAIAYGAPTSATGSCPTDTVRISACTTMQKIASEPSKFFSDNMSKTSTCTSAANSIEDLSSIFSAIVRDVTGVRLLPNDTT